MRVGDSDAITSSVKGWLFQDMLLKPEEMVTYRNVEIGGLGMHNVKMRAMSILIHTFLAEAISPSFPNNQYLNCLYRWHVLGDKSFPDPGRPPYYSNTFFTIIKHVKDTTPLNIAWVSVKQWYQLLMEKGVTHSTDDQDSPPVLISSKLEERHPGVDLSPCYHFSRMFGLSPDQKSFNFKMMQSLLPTRERLARVGKIISSDCLSCAGVMDTTAHLLTCPLGSEVTVPLLNCLRDIQPDITPQDIIIFKFRTSEALELPVAWLTSMCLAYIWEERVMDRQAKLTTMKANLISSMNLLRDTKWKYYSLHNCAVLVEELINLHFS